MVNLEQGQNIVLDDIQHVNNQLTLGLNWKGDDSNDFAVDLSAFLLRDDDKVRHSKDFIFYNQPSDPDRCIKLLPHSNIKSMRRLFEISLFKIPADIAKIMFVLTIDKATEYNQCIQMLDDLSLGIFNMQQAEIIHYNITAHNEETSLMVASFYRYQGQWKFKAIAEGFCSGLEAVADLYNVDLDELVTKDNEENTTTLTENKQVESRRRTRTSPVQVLRKHTSVLLAELQKLLPIIYDSRDKRINESNTRMVLDKIFIEVLGYRIDEVKAEQKIQGRRADYVLSLADEDVIVVEAKKAGMPLKAKQIFQATSYGAYAGIEWVLLTNLTEWRVYHISMQDKVESDLVFSVDLSDGITQQDAELLVLISRYGMSRRNLLEKQCMQVNVLAESNIVSSIMTEDVITKIRQIIRRDQGVSLTNEQIREALESVLNIN